MRSALCGVALIFLLGTSIVPAWGEIPASEQAGPERSGTAQQLPDLAPAAEKLGRGVANILGGWLEIPIGIDQGYHTSNDRASGMLAGSVRGLGNGIVRTAVGVYETVTFFLPYPEQFAPILPPLEYYRHNPTRRALPLE